MKAGYIYVLSNPIYNYYGKNVYKIGETSDLTNRLKQYTTPYIDACEYVYKSIELSDSKLAETIIKNSLIE